jgi:Xaa-Pro dipeptidase
MRECELAAEISHLQCMKGASSVAFETIVAFGANSAKPHYTPKNTRLKKGHFVLMDFGARYNMYCSDITRTLVMGKATQKQKKMYNTVLEANRLAIRKCKSGVHGKVLHELAKDYIDNHGYKDRFIHGLGHSVGLATHDGKGLNASTDFKMKKNMVFTIEPGIYIPGFGGVRIEDDVVVEKDGCKVLTKADKELIEL